jgi:hypothetical protein
MNLEIIAQDCRQQRLLNAGEEDITFGQKEVQTAHFPGL